MSIRQVGSLTELSQVFADNTYVVVDFFATWCPPCKTIAPHFEKFAAQHGVEGHLAFIKVNVEEAEDIARTYRISSMPTFMFFKNGTQVTVHGQLQILGANPAALKAVAEKMGGLALARKAAADTAA